MQSGQQQRIGDEIATFGSLAQDESTRIFGRGGNGRAKQSRRKRERTKARTFSIEALEARQMMAANLSATFANGVLSIEGTPNADQIIVRQAEAKTIVHGVTIKNASGQAVTPLTSQIKSVKIDALGGDDLIWIRNNPTLKVNAVGGAGTDLFLSGSNTTLTTDKTASEKLVSTTSAAIWKRLESVLPDTSGKVTLGSVKIGAFSFTGATATISATNISFAGTADLPLVGKVNLTGSVSTDNSTWLLSTAPGTLKIGGFTLSNVVTKVTQDGISVSGDTTLAVLGKVTFKGTISADGKYSLQATLGPKSLLNGLVQFDSTKLTLTDTKVTVEAKATVAKLGTAVFTGSIFSGGSYALKAKASINVAGFKVDGADLTYGTNELGASFTIPVPSIGNVKFSGSYGPGGAWSVKGTYPGVVTIGAVVLKEISVTVASNSLTLQALGTVAGIDGVVNAVATATIFKDGRFDMKIDAKAVKVGSFAAGNAIVTLSNNNSSRTFITTFKGTVGVPNGPNVVMDGTIDAKGNYSFSGTQNTAIAGLTLSSTKFTLVKGVGLTFSAKANYLSYKFTIAGSISTAGRFQFTGTGEAMKLPSGFSLGKVTVEGDINKPANTYKLKIQGEANVFVGTVKFSTTTNGTGTSWPTPTFTGTAQIGGALSSILSGSASFTMGSSQVSFSGNLTLKSTGLSVAVKGTVQSDGTISVKYKNGAGKWLSQLWNKGGSLVKEWLYYDGAGEKLQQFREWSSGKLSEFRKYTIDGWKNFDSYLSDGKWVEQTLNKAGDVLQVRNYFGGYGSQLQKWRAWSNGKLTDLEEFTTDGWKKVNSFLSDGKWVKQSLNKAGDILQIWNYYGGYGSQLQKWRAWSNGKLTDLEEFTTDGWKNVNKYLNSKGKWVSQNLNKAGDIVKQWVYFGGYGSKLQEFSAWAGDELTALSKYILLANGNTQQTLEAFYNSSGEWVEKHYKNGVEVAVKFWSASGKYLGDKYKNFKDVASNLDPTTQDWWPL